MTSMPRLTGVARLALECARREAVRLGHPYIGTEHVALGITRTGGGIALAMLRDLRVELDRVRAEVERKVPAGQEKLDPALHLLLTPRMKKVLKLAVCEAQVLSETDIVDSGHLLLGLIREREGVAGRVFAALRVDLERARTVRVGGVITESPQESGTSDPTNGHATVFLTGASGTVGGGVLDVLLAYGEFEVVCLVRHVQAAKLIAARGGRVVMGDLDDEIVFDRLRNEYAFTFIIHAAQASYRDHTPLHIDALERRAVRNLEQLCGPATRLMIFTSGVWMYGNGARGLPITEDTPLEPFAMSRARVELLRELMAQRTYPWAQLCPPSIVYGAEGALMKIVERLRSGSAIEVVDEPVLWSVVERHDLGRAYRALMEHGQPGDNFVVAEDAAVRVTDFYETIAAAVGQGRIVRQPLAHFAASKDKDWLEILRTSQPVDASRFKQRTGWCAQETFASSVRRFLG